jgi:hypothetical protein
MPPDRPQRVTLPTLQILAAFMSDLSRDDWYGRSVSVHTVPGVGHRAPVPLPAGELGLAASASVTDSSTWISTLIPPSMTWSAFSR